MAETGSGRVCDRLGMRDWIMEALAFTPSDVGTIKEF